MLKMFNIFKMGVFLTLSAVVGGCAAAPMNISHVPEVQNAPEPRYVTVPPPQKAEGALWSGADGISLYTDRRAHRVGDVVVVRIEENPEAELSANTKAKRSSNLSNKLKFFGLMKQIANNHPTFPQNPGSDELIKSVFESDFDGQGTSDRDGHVNAYISAMVVQVLPNGNLVISGRRQISVNHETQYILVSGVVRPEDINTNNEISSTFVADARIVYSGVGVLADKQKPGWLGRAIDHVWPF